jgi:sulfur-carrier protein
MRIKLKLFVSLTPYLPPGAKGNEVDIEIGPAESPEALLDRLHVPRELTHLWLLNGVYIEPEDRSKPVMKAADTLAIWPPVAGG